MRDNGPQSSKEVENSCHVHTGETAKHLYELRTGGCSKRLQLVSIGPNWSRSADSFGSNKVERSEGGQMVHFGHTEGVDGLMVVRRQGRMMVRPGRGGRGSSCQCNKR